MNCLRHPERKAVTSAPDARIVWRRRYMCKECSDETPKLGYARAFGTGLGPEAHAEAQESGRLQQDYDWGKPPRHIITRGGKPE